MNIDEYYCKSIETECGEESALFRATGLLVSTVVLSVSVSSQASPLVLRGGGGRSVCIHALVPTPPRQSYKASVLAFQSIKFFLLYQSRSSCPSKDASI